MKLNFKKSYLASILFPIAFIGCGGGGGGSSTSSVIPTSTTYSVSGTVPGTIIEAYCTDGSYYKVTSTNDGTSNHPFELVLPQNLECKIVMITNETDPDPTKWIVTAISINNDTNLVVDRDLDFGQVHLKTDPADAGIKLYNIDGLEASTRTLVIDIMDEDNDGIPNIYEDDDGDKIYNKVDDDDDDDGIKDIAEVSNDHDGDGILDIYDEDDDNDGIKDSDDDDYDNDGIKDDDDDDDDNDGIKDDDDDDHDNDGIDDRYDNDDNNDGYDDDSGEKYSNYTTSVSLPTSYISNDARLLASQCAQCHGTNGVSSNSWDSIKNEDDIITQERFDDADELIMQHQANGYTYEEALAIRNWLNGY